MYFNNAIISSLSVIRAYLRYPIHWFFDVAGVMTNTTNSQITTWIIIPLYEYVTHYYIIIIHYIIHITTHTHIQCIYLTISVYGAINICQLHVFLKLELVDFHIHYYSLY